MFTGIIETTGKIISIKKDKDNLIFGVESSIAKELKIGESIAHNGVCLTVTSTTSHLPPLSIGREAGPKGLLRRGEVVGTYLVTAVKETLIKTNLGSLKKGSFVNLERSLKVGDRLDGHFVQGHVDCSAEIKSIKKEKGSWQFKFGVRSTELGERNFIINKGSICINGVSLTVVVVQPETKNQKPETVFSVAIIPHTFKHTNFINLKKGDLVNIEFDVLGKYIQKIMSNRSV